MISEGGTKREDDVTAEPGRARRGGAGAGAEGAEMAEERSYGRRSDIPAWLLVPTGVSAAGLAGIHLRRASKRNSNLTGLGRWSSMPAARHCSRQPARNSAVIATIGTCRWEPSLRRISRVAAYPSISGIWQSMKIKS